jgi:hypothetical protein
MKKIKFFTVICVMFFSFSGKTDPSSRVDSWLDLGTWEKQAPGIGKSISSIRKAEYEALCNFRPHPNQVYAQLMKKMEEEGERREIKDNSSLYFSKKIHPDLEGILSSPGLGPERVFAFWTVGRVLTYNADLRQTQRDLVKTLIEDWSFLYRNAEGNTKEALARIIAEVARL